MELLLIVVFAHGVLVILHEHCKVQADVTTIFAPVLDNH